jgi:hypothetical protein
MDSASMLTCSTEDQTLQRKPSQQIKGTISQTQISAPYDHLLLAKEHIGRVYVLHQCAIRHEQQIYTTMQERSSCTVEQWLTH